MIREFRKLINIKLTFDISSISIIEMAEKIGVSTTTVGNNIKKLIDLLFLLYLKF